MLGKMLKKSLNLFASHFAGFFVFAKVAPVTVSLISLALAFGVFLAVMSGEFVSAMAFLVLSIITRLSVPILARNIGAERVFSSYFDGLSAKYSEAMVLLSFAFFHPLAGFLVVAFSLLSEYAKARAFLVVRNFEVSWPGFGDHADWMLIVAVLLLFSVFSNNFFVSPTAGFFVYAIALLALVSFVQKFFFAKKLIGDAVRKNKIMPYAG